MNPRSLLPALLAGGIVAVTAVLRPVAPVTPVRAAGQGTSTASSSLLPPTAGAAPLPPAPSPLPSPAPSPRPPAPPDELGRIPIVMYHSIGEAMTGHVAELSARTGLNVPADTFRAQLEQMWKAGWYPMNMRDVLSARIDCPRGKTPVVLTFDDARKSQFRYLPNGKIDPECAVGILVAFHEKHPLDWPLRASFYVLPESEYNPAPFGQKAFVKKKLEFLLDSGFEIANHSTTHHPMRDMTARQLAWEMSECQRYVRERVPTATMDTMALPYGIAPKEKALWDILLTDAPNGIVLDTALASSSAVALHSGLLAAAVPAVGLTAPAALPAPTPTPIPSALEPYHIRCILLAGGNPSFSPVDRRYDCKQVPRLNVDPGSLEGWIRSLSKPDGKWRPYVSDGDPETVTVPASKVADLDRSRLDGLGLSIYEDVARKPKAPPPAAKPSRGASPAPKIARAPSAPRRKA